MGRQQGHRPGACWQCGQNLWSRMGMGAESSFTSPEGGSDSGYNLRSRVQSARMLVDSDGQTDSSSWLGKWAGTTLWHGTPS